MNTFQSTLSSPRNQRILFALGLLALAAGVVVLILKLTGGGGHPTSASARSQQAKPQLPGTTQPLKNADATQVTSYSELDPSIKDNIRRFVLGAVAEQDYADSWNVLAPVFKHGYTAKTWATSDSHPIIPYPVYRYEQSAFTLMEATKKEILVSIKMMPQPNSGQRVLTFQIGLVPAATSNGTWLVDYWGPLSMVPVPDGSEN